jgi:LPS export ABC transporter protein LptC/lipopolysaccharide transport protein LptA
MSEPAPRIHDRPQRAVAALRGLLLVVLAGVALALVMTFGRRGAPQTQITISPSPASLPGQGPVVDRSVAFEIHGTREGRPAFTLRARSVTGFAGERKLLEGVELTVHPPEGGAVRVAGVEGQFDEAARRAQLYGDVVIATEEGLSLRTGTLFYDSGRDMIFTADPVAFTVGGIVGEGRGLNYLVEERQIKIPDQVRLRVSADPGAPEIAITAGDLVASLNENSAVFTGDVRMARAADVLRSNYLKLTFDADRRRVAGLYAFGEEVVAALSGPPDGRTSELSARSLTARFSAGGEAIEEAEAAGDCRVTSGPYTSRSRTARYLRGADRLDLRGDPVVLTGRDRISAQEIDLHPERQALLARGDVRTVSLASPGEGGAPGFSGRSATSFQARELRADQVSRTAVYTGAARAWQEGNSLQAEEIVVDQAGRQLRAAGSVMGRFTQRVAREGAAARPVTTSIAANGMVLDDLRGVATYRGGVRLSRPDTTLTSDVMEAFHVERDGRRDLDRVVASGSVSIKRADSYGSARLAEYRADEEILVLTDEAGLAEVVDTASGRTMRGRTLTFDLAGDRILTEPASGGRTWITLKPESKDVSSVEPKTHR